jgi:SAM-dependent methyltransferase
MENTILPAFKKLKPGKVLFIGVQNYTKHYSRWFNNDFCEYWTMDILPEVAQFGSKNKHVVGDVLEVDHHFPQNYFDIVIFNGVLGYGVDRPQCQNKALKAIHNIIKGEGILLLGWNKTQTDDPLNLDVIKKLFLYGIGELLPNRKTFSDSTCIYDVFRAKYVPDY